jgi:hypothetical protein
MIGLEAHAFASRGGSQQRTVSLRVARLNMNSLNGRPKMHTAKETEFIRGGQE